MERDTSLGFHQEDSTGERNSFGHTVTAGQNAPMGGTTSTEKDMFALNGLMDSIIDYEKQLMQQRSQLFMQVWKDRKLYQEFIEFMSYSKSPRFILVLNIVYTIFFLTPLTTLFLFQDELSITSLWLGSIEFFFASLTMLCGWTLYASIEEISPIRVVGRNLFHLKTKSDWRLFSDRVQFVLYLSLVMRHGITLVRRTLSGRCDRNTFLYLWTCNPQDSSNTFPLDSASLLMIIPILFCVVYREARIGVNIIAFLIVLFSLIYCSILLNSSQPLVISSGYFILTLVVMIDSLKQFILFYWLGRQLKKTIETNQTLAEENKATEMRHMIANVAHDMKTPLSSFMTGIDIMADDVLTFQRKFESSSSSTEKDEGRFDTNSIPSFLSNLKTCIENIRNTNSFMLMTINRCLDYTKASNGMKLVPKYETIDFEETLKLPLQCMANIQQRIKISLLPYDDQKICSHIITDKQWLQENILCLLSNAVKYSTGGEALIKVTLHKVKESQTRFFSDPKIPCFNEDDPASLNIAFNSGDESSFITFPPRSRIKFPKLSFPFPWFTNRIQKHAKVLPSPIHTSHGVSYDHSPAKTTRTPKGTEHTATISSHSSARIDMELVFEVTDNGIGISEDAMKSLFNPFKQTQRLAGGTGLGLFSLAKRIEALKGKYGVHRREDGKQGSVFWFAVPYKADEITATMTKQYKEVNGNTLRASQQGKQGSPGTDVSFMVRQNSISPSESLSILLAEDTPSIAKMTSMMLKRQNHNTDVAENGQIVLDKLFPTITTTTSDSPKKDSPSSSRQQKLHQNYDVVLMDLQMPVMDGLEATRRIRAYERELANESPHRLPPRQIVIGVSANSDNETMEEAFQAGVDDFLPKPFSINLFNEVIQRIHK